MPQRIAIIGWGSLIWDPRTLPHDGPWRKGGPVLPIEFSRISSDHRLTLVIDIENGSPTATQFTLSQRKYLQEVIRDLAVREGTNENKIGHVTFASEPISNRNSKHAPVHDCIIAWAQKHDFTGVVWTALSPNFKSKTGRQFSVQHAYEYLESLAGLPRDQALRYIANSPSEVNSPLRLEINKRPITFSKEIS